MTRYTLFVPSSFILSSLFLYSHSVPFQFLASLLLLILFVFTQTSNFSCLLVSLRLLLFAQLASGFCFVYCPFFLISSFSLFLLLTSIVLFQPVLLCLPSLLLLVVVLTMPCSVYCALATLYVVLIFYICSILLSYSFSHICYHLIFPCFRLKLLCPYPLKLFWFVSSELALCYFSCFMFSPHFLESSSLILVYIIYSCSPSFFLCCALNVLTYFTSELFPNHGPNFHVL